MQQQLYELLCDFCFYYPGSTYAFKPNGLLSISIPLSIFIFFVVRVAEKTIDFSFLRFDSLLPVSWDYLVWNNFLKSKSFLKDRRMEWNEIASGSTVYAWLCRELCPPFLCPFFLSCFCWNEIMENNESLLREILYEMLRECLSLHEIIENN